MSYTGKAADIIQWLFNQDKEKIYEIKEYKQKRSLNANAYAWVLMNELANVHRTDKDSVYLMMLKRYGQHEVVSIISEVDICGYFKYYDILGYTVLQGKNFTHYRIYKGSSEYNTREMAIFIDGIVSECKECGIETMTPYELERMKQKWKA